jgi:hypothetical protein
MTRKSKVTKPTRLGVAIFVKEARRCLRKHGVRNVSVSVEIKDGQPVYHFDGDAASFQEAFLAIQSEMNPSRNLPIRRA